VKDAVFSAFLIIDDELDGNPGFPGPLWVRGILAVADHVARIIFHVISKRNGNIFQKILTFILSKLQLKI
jgi:hypothetical protein